jgi:hypothetical protein
MRKVILFRAADVVPGEIEAANSAGFFCTESRMDIRPGDLVIGRYSVLPFYHEQYRDVQLAGATLINSFLQHRYVADIAAWYPDLKPYTPETWLRPEDVPREEDGPFVLKGNTNSRKFDWKTHMFAANRKAVDDVAWRLNMDGLIGHQEVCVRRYVPLFKYGEGLNGLPITKEFRFFVCDGIVLSGGYYWSSHLDVVSEIPSIEEVPTSWLQEVVDIVCRRIPFVVIDVAITAEGKPIVVELNDAQMSGPSENDLPTLYKELARVLT